MPTVSRRAGSAILLGIALGGFFDGIVLHQVLQWHHLLSALQTPGRLDLRAQVMADGLFHAAMYVLALVGLKGLLGPGRSAGPPEATSILAGRVLLGFAAWHALDAVLSHGLLGLHRIRMDAASPLVWDLGWVFVFGVLPGLLGWTLLKRPPDDRRGGGPGGAGRSGADRPLPTPPGAAAGPGGHAHRSVSFARSLGVLVTLAGLLAAFPVVGTSEPDDAVVVLRPPGTEAGAWLNRLAAHDARWVWLDPAAGVAVIRSGAGPALPGWRDGVWVLRGRVAALACAGRLV